MTDSSFNSAYYHSYLGGWLTTGMRMLASDTKFLALKTDKERLAYVEVKLKEADVAATKNATRSKK
jgi:hypothetical protein